MAVDEVVSISQNKDENYLDYISGCFNVLLPRIND